MLMNLFDKRPNVAVDSFVAPNASVVGDVVLSTSSSVWYGAILRGTFLSRFSLHELDETDIDSFLFH